MPRVRVKPGDVLGGKYKVERILGTGGMGVVVAAWNMDLGQRVALKLMLNGSIGDPEQAERFLREAKAAVLLKSVHTARVLDVGRLKNDEPYMVMEYLEGRDLDAELAACGPLPPHAAVDYILQAAEALAEAHGLGMIHRDIKLKNLFLTSAVDGRPLVKVLDFGLAKTLGAHGDPALTTSDTVFGSPRYMSPEQMRSAKNVDFRSDIWSLGICLYELLTGRVPYEAQGVAEICAMVLKDAVPPPSQFVYTLPVDLERVILRCLEKDPARRFPSIADLAFALQDYAADQGSAQRILHVMQNSEASLSLKRAHLKHLNAEQGTMNGWDSGVAGRATQNILTRTQFIGVFAFVVLMGIIGAAAITVAVKKRAETTAEAAELAPTNSPAPPPPATGFGAAGAPTPATPSAAPMASAAASQAVAAPSAAPTEQGTATAKSTSTTPPKAPAARPTKPKGPGRGADYM
ncbi:MAG TPA: serine/threonine-protein kinase [Labilithrix sp.]|nr:serine/threonine-protein kinase [Labilithrix sp.]